MPRANSSTDLEQIREEVLSKTDSDKPCITLCAGAACRASGSESIAQAFQEELKKQGLDQQVKFKRTGCHGFCERGPITLFRLKGSVTSE